MTQKALSPTEKGINKVPIMKTFHRFFLTVVSYFAIAAHPAPLLSQAHQDGLPFIRNFTPGEYSYHDQNWAITQDLRGIMYFGNTSGVLEFDGINWRRIQVSNRSVVRSLAVDSAGTIYVGAKAEFGMLAPDSLGLLEYRSLTGYLDSSYRNFSDVWKIFVTNDGIFFQTARYLFRWRGGVIKSWPAKTNFHTSFFVNDKLYVREPEIGLLVLNGDSLQLVPNGGRFKDERIYIMTAFDRNRIMVGTRQSGFYLYDEKTFLQFKLPADTLLGKAQVYDVTRTAEGYFALATLQSGLVIMDTVGRISAILDKSAGLQDNVIFAVFKDRNGNLWTALSKGISRIHWPSPMAFFHGAHDLPGQIISMGMYDGKLYAGTFSGLFYWEAGRFKKVESIRGIVMDIVTAGDVLFAAGPDGLYELKGNKVRVFVKENVLGLSFSKHFPNRIYLGLKSGAGFLKKENNRWIWTGRIPGINEEIRTIEESDSHAWFTSIFEGTIRAPLDEDSLKTGTGLKRFGLAEGLPDLKDLGVIRDSMGVHFLTKKGIFTFDEATQRMIEDRRYRKLFDGAYRIFTLGMSLSNLVCFYVNDRIGVAAQNANGELEWKIPLFHSWLPDDQINAILSDGLHSFWLGTMSGITHLDASRAFSETRRPIRALIRRVTLEKDSLLFGGFSASKELLEISYSNKELRLEFAAPFFDLESAVEYQYYLSGLDDDWSEWNKEAFKSYTNLPEGAYAFHVRARNFQGRISDETGLSLIVLPPWYRTWWMKLIYALLFAGTVAAFVRFQVARARQRAGELLERQREESRLKEAELRAAAAEAEIENARKIAEINQELQKALDELKNTQVQLIQSAKMASLGQMTAGIAHEINNPLAFVHGNLEYFKHTIEKLARAFQEWKAAVSDQAKQNALNNVMNELEHVETEFADHLNTTLTGSLRIRDIVENLRKFARVGEQGTKETNVNSDLEAIMDLFVKQHDDIRIERQFADSVYVVGNVSELNQCYLNLLTNAVQAIRESEKHGKLKAGDGFIGVRTESMTQGEKRRIRITVSDNGIGISEENKSKIFDPFFTTRAIGQGRGLGLAETYGIIHKHGGTIEVQSELNKGSSFIITLPQDGVA